MLQRQGTGKTRTARLPERNGQRYFLELCSVWDGTWFVQLHITHTDAEGREQYARRSAVAATFEQAVMKISELYGDPLQISVCTEVYCYPPQPGDWYRTPVVLRGPGILTTFGQAIARFDGKRLVAADTAWKEQAEAVAQEYAKPHNQRLEDLSLIHIYEPTRPY
mgnify:CR=1 FL=1